MRAFDLIVIGGGISGVFTSYFASLRGMKVALVELGHLGSGSSGRSAGIHTEQLILPIDIELSRRSREIYQEVAPLGFLKTGFLSVEPSWMSSYSAQILSSAGTRFKVLSYDELRSYIEWALVRDDEVGILTPDDGVVDVPHVLETMRRRLLGLGAVIFENSKISRLNLGDGRITLTNGSCDETLSFSNLVLAAGAWNRGISERWLGYRPPVAIYACQLMLMKTSVELGATPVYFEDSHTYIRGMGKSFVLVGNGRVVRLNDPSKCPAGPEPEYLLEMSEKLAQRLRHPVDYFPSGGWTGVCSSSADGMPIVGRLPGLENVYIVDALDGYGIMRAPALAQDLAAFVADGKASEALKTFDPSRFGRVCKEPDEIIELHSMP